MGGKSGRVFFAAASATNRTKLESLSVNSEVESVKSAAVVEVVASFLVVRPGTCGAVTAGVSPQRLGLTGSEEGVDCGGDDNDDWFGACCCLLLLLFFLASDRRRGGGFCKA